MTTLANILLAEILPLRTTRMLGDFAEDKPLPHRYGDLTRARFELIKLSDTEYFAADHPMEITGVQVADQDTDSWEQQTRSDDKGNNWTVVILGAPPVPGSSVTATGRGKRNPKTGQLLENAAEIIEDVLRLAGRVEHWVRLRAESAAAGLRLAGSVGTLDKLQAHLDAITQSCAAIWTPGDGRLYPVTEVTGPVLELERSSVSNIQASTDLVDTADVLRLSYDFSEAKGKPQHFIELTASPRRFDGVVQELTFPMLRSPRDAEAVARRVLAWLAGERYDVTFDVDRIDIRPGQWVKLVNNPEWPIPGPDPIVMVLDVAVTPDRSATQIIGETVLAFPTAKVTAHSVALPDDISAGVDVSFVNGVATFTIHDDNDAPLAGARASLDNGETRITNTSGKVSFTTKKGHHLLAVAAAGFIEFVVEFDL